MMCRVQTMAFITAMWATSTDWTGRWTVWRCSVSFFLRFYLNLYLKNHFPSFSPDLLHRSPPARPIDSRCLRIPRFALSCLFRPETGFGVCLDEEWKTNGRTGQTGGVREFFLINDQILTIGTELPFWVCNKFEGKPLDELNVLRWAMWMWSWHRWNCWSRVGFGFWIFKKNFRKNLKSF